MLWDLPLARDGTSTNDDVGGSRWFRQAVYSPMIWTYPDAQGLCRFLLAQRLLAWASLFFASICCSGMAWGWEQGTADVAQASFARPIDLAFLGDRLIVACEEPPSLVVIDAIANRVVTHVPLAGIPAKLLSASATEVRVLDASRSVIETYRLEDDRLALQATFACVTDPIRATQSDQRLYVSGRWSRQVAAYTLPESPHGRFQQDPAWTTDLDFVPGTLAVLAEEDLLVVADYYGSHWVTLRCADGSEVSRQTFFGHRLRGLLPDPDGYFVVLHQLLNAASQTERQDIHWGTVLSNDVRWMRREHLASPDPQLFYKGSQIERVGEVGNGAAEPNDLEMTHDGVLVVACGGSNEIAIGKRDDYALRRFSVGINPVAVSLSPDEKYAWVACKLEHSLVCVDIAAMRTRATIYLSEPQTQLTALQRGERLFHDANLAHDQWMTCASCHPDGHTIADRSDNFGDGNYGAPKRIPSLLGHGRTEPFGWVGLDATLESQIQRSIEKTMNSPDSPTAQDVQDLATFVRSLKAPPSIDIARGRLDRTRVQEGRRIFNLHGCAECHAGPDFTSDKLYHVGTEDSVGQKEFNPPSLIGVGQAGPGYLHDGRAKTLRSVFEEFHHPTGESWTTVELESLLVFLRSL